MGPPAAPAALADVALPRRAVAQAVLRATGATRALPRAADPTRALPRAAGATASRTAAGRVPGRPAAVGVPRLPAAGLPGARPGAAGVTPASAARAAEATSGDGAAGRAATRPAGPPGYAPTPARKRRRWPWYLLLMLACCCGCPAYYGVPMASQYPAEASLPAEVADLRLRDDNTSKATAKQLEADVRKAHWLAEKTFAGVYATPAGKRVTVFGGTGFRFTPESDAEDEITRLTGQYSLGEAQVVDTGVRGRHQRCAVGRADGQDVVVCTSVDHGSIATAVFTRLSLDDSATLLGTLREQMVTTSQK